MNDSSVSESRSWPNLALIAGGLLMVPMWVRFTTLHGPTSFNEDGHWLGQGAIFWGGMMGLASLLIVIGVYGHRALLVSAAFLMNAIPQETLDRFQWYRLYGILSNVLFGLGWVVFGASLARKQRTARDETKATAAYS